MRRHYALLFATSGHGGVDRVVQNLLPEFGKTNHRFDLLLIRKHGPYLDEVPPNVTVRRLPSGSKNTVLPGLVWYLFRERPHGLLTANHKLNRAALMARHITGVPIRIAIRMGMSVSAQREVLKPGQVERLYASMRRWYPLADAVVTPSQGVGDDLVAIAGIDPERLRVIPNPIVNDRFHELAAQPVEHQWFGDSECPVVLGVGSLEARKDFVTLIRAFARVRQQLLCRLVILGDGKQRHALLELAKQLGVSRDIDLPGFEHNPYRFMARADVFVLSSRREGASAVVVEALACGTPVVSTDCPSGPAETLQNGRVGALVPVGDDEAMAAAIIDMLKSPPDRRLLQQAVERNRADLAAREYLRALGLED